ncbi:adenosine kinase [Alphaproteobacteria bacterium]|nr:adenosine kinase [Alphaproteobacteria bacterium]
MSKYQICFIGNAIIDILSKFSDENLKELKIPKGSMQLVDEKSSNLILDYIKNPIIISGGSAANTAVGFSSFGGTCSFIGQIGNDDFGILFSKDLNNSGVFFENKMVSTLQKTSKSIVLVTPDAERSMNTYLGASVQLNIDCINKNLIINSNIIYIEGYLFDQSDAKKAIYYCCELAKANNCKVALSLSDSFCVDRHREEFSYLINKFVDIIFANETEIQSLYKLNLQESLKKIKENTEVGAITLGSKGSIVFQNQIESLVPSIIINDPVDTTGAGDIFASGFLFGLTNNYSIKDCGKLGNKVAADIIKYIGARPKTSLKTFLS